MKCPKCGGEIPFYDLKPDCRHCGVNILYYIQDHELEKDAKLSELESASVRMVIARIKTVFIGSFDAVLRMIFILLAVCSLMVPFCTVSFKLPFYSEKLSVGLIGVIQSFGDGLLAAVPDYLKSTMFSDTALGAAAVTVLFAILALIDVIILIVFLLSFLNPEKTAVILKRLSLTACIDAVCAQAAALICGMFVVKAHGYASFSAGFGAAVCLIMHLILVIINKKMLKKGIKPVYREFDPMRKEMLKKVKKGEVLLDDLPLPVFESEEEYEMRMNEFKHAMQEETAAELEAEIQAKEKRGADEQ